MATEADMPESITIRVCEMRSLLSSMTGLAFLFAADNEFENDMIVNSCIR